MNLSDPSPLLFIIDQTRGVVTRLLAPLAPQADMLWIADGPTSMDLDGPAVIVVAGTGTEAALALSSLSTATVERRVLVALNDLADETATNLYELGACDVFELPWQLDDLQRKARHFVQWARRRREVLPPAPRHRSPLASRARLNDNLLRLVLDRSEAFLCVTDAEGTIIHAEGEVLRRLGQAPEQLVGSSLLELCPGKRAVVESIFCAVDGAAVELQTRVGDRAFDSFFTRLDGVSGVVCVAFDASRRAHMEATLARAQRLEAMGFFAAGLTHDFKNLLMMIASAAKLVLDSGQVSGETIEDVREIIDATQRGEAITRHLMAFGRVNTPAAEVLEVSSAIRSISRVFQRSVGRGIRFDVRGAERPLPVFIERAQLDQVVLNLLVNARDAMPHGGTLTLEVTTRTLDARPDLRAGLYAALVVRDTGVGIDEALRTRIFEPFFTTKGPGEGHGLGLATSVNIVSQAAGTIELDSAVGVGTTFTVLLPLAEQRSHFSVASESGVFKRASDDFAAPSLVGTAASTG